MKRQSAKTQPRGKGPKFRPATAQQSVGLAKLRELADIDYALVTDDDDILVQIPENEGPPLRENARIAAEKLAGLAPAPKQGAAIAT